jgi:hypothetical protein
VSARSPQPAHHLPAQRLRREQGSGLSPLSYFLASCLDRQISRMKVMHLESVSNEYVAHSGEVLEAGAQRLGNLLYSTRRGWTLMRQRFGCRPTDRIGREMPLRRKRARDRCFPTAITVIDAVGRGGSVTGTRIPIFAGQLAAQDPIRPGKLAESRRDRSMCPDDETRPRADRSKRNGHTLSGPGSDRRCRSQSTRDQILLMIRPKRVSTRRFSGVALSSAPISIARATS